MLCIRCMSPQLKELLAQEVADVALRNAILLLDDCPQGVSLQIEDGPKKRRELSGYQEFMGRCLRETGIRSFGSAAQAMRQCAAQWRNRQNGRTDGGKVEHRSS